MKLMTIGYEGLNLDQFFTLLRDGGVDTIIDVRQNPLSRKKGFSKTALSTAATERGFEYVHLREFGCPREVRNTYRDNGNWSEYVQSYTQYMDTLDIAFAMLAKNAQSSQCCLLCFEADPLTCHRSLVAERFSGIYKEPVSVVHLRA